MNSLQKYMAERLAQNGGFSHRFIASRVFDKKLALVTDHERNTVSAYLTYVAIKVTAWRNGETTQAKTLAKHVLGKAATSNLPKPLSRPKKGRVKYRKTA
jgi:hypothetical protein